MRKKFLFFFLIVSLLISSQLIFVEDSKAACAESSPGVISQVAVLASCEDEPTSYGIIIYNLYLCTAAPAAPTIASSIDLTNCVETFSNSAGYFASVSNGAAVNLNGTATLPPNGTYTHGIVKMDNTFALTASKQFEIAYNGQVSGTGVYCSTADGSGTVASGGVAGLPTNTTICGSSPVEAGTHTQTLTSMDDVFTATATGTNIAGTGANVTAYLVDADQNLAANEVEVDKLNAVVEFASAATITSSTTNIDVSFNVGEGMQISSGNLNGAIFFGIGPFQATITVTP